MKLNRHLRRKYAKCIEKNGSHLFKMHVIEPNERNGNRRVVFGRCDHCGCPMGPKDTGVPA